MAEPKACSLCGGNAPAPKRATINPAGPTRLCNSCFAYMAERHTWVCHGCEIKWTGNGYAAECPNCEKPASEGLNFCTDDYETILQEVDSHERD